LDSFDAYLFYLTIGGITAAIMNMVSMSIYLLRKVVEKNEKDPSSIEHEASEIEENTENLRNKLKE
jgi:hypothetical protein